MAHRIAFCDAKFPDRVHKAKHNVLHKVTYCGGSTVQVASMLEFGLVFLNVCEWTTTTGTGTTGTKSHISAGHVLHTIARLSLHYRMSP